MSPRTRLAASAPPGGFDRLVEQIENALPRGNALLQRTGHADQAAQRLAMLTSATRKRQQVAHGAASMHDIGDRDRQHDSGAERHHHLHHRIRQALGEHQAHVRAAVVLVDGLELRVLIILRVVDLDDPRRVQRFLGDARDVAHRVLDAPAVAAELAVDDRDQPRDQRTHGQRDQRQPRVEIEQHRRSSRRSSALRAR